MQWLKMQSFIYQVDWILAERILGLALNDSLGSILLHMILILLGSVG